MFSYQSSETKCDVNYLLFLYLISPLESPIDEIFFWMYAALLKPGFCKKLIRCTNLYANYMFTSASNDTIVVLLDLMILFAKRKMTTNLAYKILATENEMDSIFIDYPLLVRLNPNIPWKTRGNGAVCLRVKSEQPEQIIEYLLDTVRRESDLSNGANPGVAIFEGEDIPLALRQFSSRAMYDVIDIKEIENLASQLSIQTFKFGEGLGIIGAVASIGSLLECDHTYEAIAYRKEQFCGSPRKLTDQRY